MSLSHVAHAEYVDESDWNALVDAANLLEPLSVRTGCRLRRVANQSIATGGSPSTISWDTEDQDTHGFIIAHATTGTLITIPSGKAGLYSGMFTLFGGVTGRSFIQAIITSANTGYPTDHRVPISDSEDRGVLALSKIPMLAGDTLLIQVFHSTGSSVNFTGWGTWYRDGL